MSAVGPLELQSNKNQPGGYPGIDSNGNVLGVAFTVTPAAEDTTIGTKATLAEVNSTGGQVVVTLDPGVEVGVELIVMLVAGTNMVTIAPTEAGTIDGATVSGALYAVGDHYRFVWDGTTWRVIEVVLEQLVWPASTTWTCPAGVHYADAEMIGGGTAGAAGSTDNPVGGDPGPTNAAIGAVAGPCGQYVRGLAQVVPGTAYPIVVGAGGPSSVNYSSPNFGVSPPVGAVGTSGSGGGMSSAFGLSALGGNVVYGLEPGTAIAAGNTQPLATYYPGGDFTNPASFTFAELFAGTGPAYVHIVAGMSGVEALLEQTSAGLWAGIGGGTATATLGGGGGGAAQSDTPFVVVPNTPSTTGNGVAGQNATQPGCGGGGGGAAAPSPNAATLYKGGPGGAGAPGIVKAKVSA